MTYALRVKFKSNEAPWSGNHEPASWHQPQDDHAAIKWAVGMSEGLGQNYLVTLVKDGNVVTLPATVTDCIFGKCDCRSAAVCKFTRCKNCDWPIGDDGKTLVDHGGQDEHLEVCPDCGGPLNERRVYGALSD